MLCASAFTAKDVNTIGAYKNKCFKWGYFTKVDELDLDELNERHKASERSVRIMWCARFIELKHPELPVKLAARLKRKGYNFVIDMFGSGEELERTKFLAYSLNVKDCVKFKGNRPNDQILDEMRRHDIFLFTSDKNEGWGAVLNEAMSNGCAVVGSNEIGAVPFLIEDGVNGLIFKSRDLDSLEKEVVYLIEHPNERAKMIKNAYRTMRQVWSPENAAKQFLQLVEALKDNDESLIPSYGPGSKI
jgi:glycosyltransferase involved in cell wall biosynthesis